MCQVLGAQDCLKIGMIRATLGEELLPMHETDQRKGMLADVTDAACEIMERLGKLKKSGKSFKELLDEQRLDAKAAEEAALEEVLQAPPAHRDLGFRRLADRLATWVMLAGLSRADALADAAAMTRRHLGALRVDDAYIELVGRLQRS